MIESVLNSSMIPWLEQSLRFGEKRQEALAGNIANIDTPNYKTRDLPVDDFHQALRSAIQTARNPNALKPISSGGPASMKLTPEQMLDPQLFQARADQAHNLTFHDEGNRSIEHEITEMTKNMMMQSYAMELMVAQLNTLQAVISERA